MRVGSAAEGGAGGGVAVLAGSGSGGAAVTAGAAEAALTGPGGASALGGRGSVPRERLTVRRGMDGSQA
jgi:hypothetical protein